MSTYPYITSTGTDAYQLTVSSTTDANLMLNQFQQNETITRSGIDNIIAGTNIFVDTTFPENPIISTTGVGTGIVESIVEGTNINVDDTDPANPIVSTNAGIVVEIVAGPGITVDNTDPANPVISATNSVASIVAGTNITVDNTDPLNPIVTGENGGVQSIVAGTNVTLTGTAADPVINVLGDIESVVAGDNITVDNTDPANPIVTGENGGVQRIFAGLGIVITGTITNPIINTTLPALANGGFWAECEFYFYDTFYQYIRFLTPTFDTNNYRISGTTFELPSGTHLVMVQFYMVEDESVSPRGYIMVTTSGLTTDPGIAIPVFTVNGTPTAYSSRHTFFLRGSGEIRFRSLGKGLMGGRGSNGLARSFISVITFED